MIDKEHKVEMIDKESTLLYSILILSILLVMLTSFQNYTVAVGSDEHAYIRAAQDILNLKLSREDPLLDVLYNGTIKTDEAVYVYYGSYVLEDGKIHLITTLGFPLILALAILLFGFNSVFFVNSFFLGLFLVSLFFMVRWLFHQEKDRDIIAVFAVQLAVLTNNMLLVLSLTPWLDLSALAFLTLSMYLLLKAKNFRDKWLRYTLISSFFVGLSCTIRLTNSLILLPYVLYLLTEFKGKLKYTDFVFIVILFLFGSVIIPIQNYLLSGDIFKPAQYRTAANLSPLNFGGSYYPNLIILLQTYEPIVVSLSLIGLIYSLKKSEIKYLVFPSILIFFIFFSLQPPTEDSFSIRRYLIVLHPLITLMASVGLLELIDLFDKKTLTPNLKQYKLESYLTVFGFILIVFDLIYNLIITKNLELRYFDQIIVLLGLVLILYRYLPSNKTKNSFLLILFIPILLLPSHYPVVNPKQLQLDNLSQLSSVIENNTKDESVILCCRYLSEVIDLNTKRRSIPLPDTAKKLSNNEIISRILDSNTPVYLIDNIDRNNCSAYIVSLTNEFNMTAIAQIDAIQLDLMDQCGKKNCTIYEIRNKSSLYSLSK